jgi:diguanylate cyclase (GGDEF)-like protein
VDLTFLPDVFSLLVFLVAFRPLARRAGAHTNLWFLGAGFIALHNLTLIFSGPGEPRNIGLRLAAIWSIDLAAIAFVLVSSNTPARGPGRLLALALAVPVMVQSTLSALHVPWHAAYIVASCLFFAPGLYVLVVWRKRNPRMVAGGIAFALFGMATLPVCWRNQEMVTQGALALLFISSGYLCLVCAGRYTRGVLVTTAGFASWGITFPLAAFAHQHFPGLPIDSNLLRLPQYLILAGFLLTLLEEHVLRTERMAMHDPLTDLPNRRLFEERLIATMEEARISRTTVACLVIDVDNFKTVNDTLGHNAGDQLLRALAVRLSWHMSPRDILARTGGDEFTALLAGVRDEHHLRFIAGAMMSASSVPIMIEGHSVDLRISIGIALSPDDAEDIDGLRRAADEAMYSAKRRGGSLLAFAGEDD